MSGLMNADVLPLGGVPRSFSVTAYAPCAQLDEKVDSAELIARSDPIADASLPDMRARSRPGTAIAAMMPMIATTISSSISVNPSCLRIFTVPPEVGCKKARPVSGRGLLEQPECHAQPFVSADATACSFS